MSGTRLLKSLIAATDTTRASCRTCVPAASGSNSARAAANSQRRSFNQYSHGSSSFPLRITSTALVGTITIVGLGYILYRPTLLESLSPPKLQLENHGLIPYSEVQLHNTPEDLWVIINGKVYDLTMFAASAHPGGAGPIVKAAGHDATQIFNALHPPGTIDSLDSDAFVGNVDPATLPSFSSSSSSRIPSAGTSEEEESARETQLSEIIGLPDFDAAAKVKLTAKAWAYMSSGATDQVSLDLNRSAWSSILFRPRVLIDVSSVDTSTTFLSQTTKFPFFISPTGMAGLAHPNLAERGFAAAASEYGVVQMISTNASAPLEEIVAAGKEGQGFFMQLYVDRSRAKTEKLLKKINDLPGIKGIFITVDAPAPGKREADERSRAKIEVASGISGGKIATDNKGGGIGRSVGGFIDPALNWDDIAWIRKNTKLPIGLKGIQSVEDAKKAVEVGVDAIYLSNHGGRALDTAPPSIYTLLEIRRHAPEVLNKCEIYLDGGVRRGTDVVKALCLGARGVGLGRPFLYSLTYGIEGVEHAVEILADEIQTTMRLLGVTKLDQLGPHLVNTKALDERILDKLPPDPFKK